MFYINCMLNDSLLGQIKYIIKVNSICFFLLYLITFVVCITFHFYFITFLLKALVSSLSWSQTAWLGLDPLGSYSFPHNWELCHCWGPLLKNKWNSSVPTWYDIISYLDSFQPFLPVWGQEHSLPSSSVSVLLKSRKIQGHWPRHRTPQEPSYRLEPHYC